MWPWVKLLLLKIFLIAGLWVITGTCLPAFAEPHQPTQAELHALAQQFAARVSQKFDAADRAMGLPAAESRIVLPEGELLMFTVALPKNITLDNLITAEVHDRGLLLSLRDTITVLEFPIQFDGTQAEGWYIREPRKFSLDANLREVRTFEGKFEFSPKVQIHDNDVWVPADEIGQWFGIGFTTKTSELLFDLHPSTPLPVQERIARKGHNFLARRTESPKLPLHAEPAKAIDFPFVDVSSRTAFQKRGHGGGTDTARDATIATTGDFAYGTLLTQTRLNDEDRLASLRATYKQETLEPSLLGPLKARKYELGNINLQSQPLTTNRPGGLGAHITNVDPLRNTFDANTDISGYALPGWDVELYRGNQFLGSQTVGEDGRYNFIQVDLFSTDNNFRVVLYGPQGEVREESISVPVNVDRLRQKESAYDISLTFDQTEVHTANKPNSEDYAKPRLNARFDTPLGAESLASLGLEAGQNKGEQTTVAHVDFSTKAMNTIFNLNGATDQKGDSAAELVTRRSFGEHDFRNTTEVATKGFDTTDDNDDGNGHDQFTNEFALNGPLPIGIGNRPRYNLNLNYVVDADDESTTSGIVGFNTGFGRLSFNQQFRYQLADVNQLDSLTTLSGTIGRNRLRLASEYEIKPKQQMDTLRATLQRSIGDDLTLDASVNRYFQQRLTEGTAQVNWQAGHVLLSPSLSYNSEGDVTAILNSRFGAMREPQSGDLRMFDRPISLNGGLSVFVYLDQNGNGIHDDGEQPIPKAIIAAPQNGGREQTDDSGFAYFSRLEKLRLTDVYIEPDSLQDPYWVPATKGASILPREGHVSQLAFPVLMAGEVEGTVYTRTRDGTASPVRGAPMTLYNKAGEKIADTATGADGYYLLSPVPPGDYWLVTGGDVIRNNTYQRPAPASVKIGYEGTIISGNDIYMDEGLEDAPVRVLANLSEFQAEQPGLSLEAIRDQKITLNLGTYHSRMLMGLVWYKARSFQANAVAGLKTLVAPADSYAAANTGLHTLRIGNEDLEYSDALARCGQLNAGGINCTVEILPGGLERFSDTPETHAAL